MPQIGDELQQHKAGNFSYSAAKLNTLAASEYTLVTIASDVSGSVAGFKKEMEIALKESAEMCIHSPRVDNLLLRHIQFADTVEETMGFTLFATINTSRFDNCLNIAGYTALNDAMINAVEASGSYGEQLAGADFSANGLIIVITDGCNNNSNATVTMIQNAIKKVRQSEKLESLAIIVVGVNINDPTTSSTLKQWIQDCGLDVTTDYIELKDATKKTLAKLAKFISKSISASSQALGTGGVSKQLAGPLQQSLTI